MVFIVLTLVAVVVLPTPLTVPDGACYLSYLDSLVVDRDMYFEDQYQSLGVQSKWSAVADTGYQINMFPVGAPALWLPFHLVGKGLSALLVGTTDPGDPTPFLTNVKSVHLGTAAFGCIALLLAYRIANELVSPMAAIAATAAVAIGSPFAMYWLYFGIYAHVPAALAACAFLWLWMTTIEDRTRAQWIALGLVAGIATIARWQNGLLLFLPFSDLIVHSLRNSTMRTTCRNALLVCLPFSFVAATQAAIWWRIFGTPLTIPQRAHRFEWTHPEVLSFLFSSHHGLLSWTPIAALCLLGLILLALHRPRIGIPVVALFVVQIYVNSAFDWWSGMSFGARRMVDLTGFSVLGLAWLIELTRDHAWRRIVTAIACGGCIGWTTGLAIPFLGGDLEPEGYVSWGELAHSQVQTWFDPASTATTVWRTVADSGFSLPFLVSALLVIGSAALGALLWENVKQTLLRASDDVHITIGCAALGVCAPFLAVAMQPIPATPLQSELVRDLLARDAELEARLQPDDHQDPGGLRERSEIAFRLGRYGASASFLEQYLQLIPKDIEAIYDLGICYLNHEQPAKAINHLKTAVAADPDNAKTLHHLGIAHLESGDFSSALSTFQDLQQANLRGEARYWQSYCLLRLGRQDEAIEILDVLASENLDDYQSKRLLQRARNWTW
jgi:cytochrome c-type biogenesis protein CcmH/NrfG